MRREAQRPEPWASKRRRSTGMPGPPRPREVSSLAIARTDHVDREPPKLRGTFPPLEPEREAMLRERNRCVFEADPRLEFLERRLLELGGLMALLFRPDPDIGRLLERGRYFPGSGARIGRGQESACHGNAGLLFVESAGTVRIATGYALLDDGLWRQHSWGVAAEDWRVVETTERRIRYYGFVLSDAEMLMFAVQNLPVEDLSARDLRRVSRFIAKYYRISPELVEYLALITPGSSKTSGMMMSPPGEQEPADLLAFLKENRLPVDPRVRAVPLARQVSTGGRHLVEEIET